MNDLPGFHPKRDEDDHKNGNDGAGQQAES
jgi:hypothetical protein